MPYLQPSHSGRGRRGATITEFVLIFMIFLVLTAGLVEMGRGVWAYNTIAHATRQGVRFASIRGSENPTTAYEVRDAVRNAAIGLDRKRIEVRTTWPTGIERGEVVEVQVSYPFRLVSGSLILPQSSVTLRSSSRAILAN
jgi:Flp pilus assembly protein TadG